VRDDNTAHRRGDARSSRTGADRLLVVGVAVAGLAVLVVAVMIAVSVFGPKPAPRTEAERLLQVGLDAVASNPTSSTAHIDLGGAYFEMGQYDAAEREFDTALALSNGSPVPLYNLAQVYRLTGRHEEATEAFGKVISKAGEAMKWKAPGKMFTDARFWLGVECVLLKRYGDAIKALEPVMQNKPLDGEAAKTLARAYEATGQIEKAVALYNRVLAVLPTDIEASAALKRLGK
jgi:tetratricopeptide (TPR) repeat protein